METNLFKVKDGFKVHQLMVLVDINFIYSTTKGSNEFTLLNAAEFGVTSKEQIDKLIVNNRVAILTNDTLEMTTYNIPESEILAALLQMN